MPEKKLPVALIGAFFVIGVLLGLLFIDSSTYRTFRDEIQAYSGATEKGSSNGSVSGKSVPQRLHSDTAPPDSPGNVIGDATETFICDKASAEAIRNKAREIAEISETAGGTLNVRLREQWSYYTPGIRMSFLQAFAESDTCLLGHSRTIHFYYKG